MMDNKILVFSHLMKTGGTSLNQHLKGCYGSKMHVVTKARNLLLDGDPYDKEEFGDDLKKFKELKVISGHQVRPFIDYGVFEEYFKWMIILRHPHKRFVSHYIQITNREGSIHKGLSIEEWERRFDTSNYMVRFIAGKSDLNLAKEILKEKFMVVGLTEELNHTINMMRAVMGDNKFKLPRESHKNKSTDNTLKNSLLNNKIDFIKKSNDLDLKLYHFVKNELWPTQLRHIDTSKVDNKKNSLLLENLNKIRFQRKRYKYHSGKLTIGNLKYFLRNW